jgi:hypothetical protein
MMGAAAETPTPTLPSSCCYNLQILRWNYSTGENRLKQHRQLDMCQLENTLGAQAPLPREPPPQSPSPSPSKYLIVGLGSRVFRHRTRLPLQVHPKLSRGQGQKTKTIVITIITMLSPQVFSLHSLTPLHSHCTMYDSCGSTVFVLLWSGETRHERSYNENYTPSRPLWEVKSHLAWSVVRWVTTCEARVLFVLYC